MSVMMKHFAAFLARSARLARSACLARSVRLALPFGLALASTGLLATSAQAENPADMVQIRVLPGWSSDDGSHMAALHLSLAPGWKTYWRAPGDAGIPPMLDLGGSHNLADLTPIWPTPHVFSQNGMHTVGYESELVLPLHVKPQISGQAARIAAQMQIGICRNVCVPVEFAFTLDLPTQGTEAQQHLIRTALADQPVSAGQARVSHVSCTLTPIRDGLGLSVTIDMPSAGGTETVLIETADPQVWVAETNSNRTGHQLTARTELVHVSGQAFALDRSGLRFTVLGADRAVDIHGCKG
ncbi:MAG: protein-disulfide reductase DsbD domain-containing protein [Rhodobacterales bacterium]